MENNSLHRRSKLTKINHVLLRIQKHFTNLKG